MVVADLSRVASFPPTGPPPVRPVALLPGDPSSTTRLVSHGTALRAFFPPDPSRGLSVTRHSLYTGTSESLRVRTNNLINNDLINDYNGSKCVTVHPAAAGVAASAEGRVVSVVVAGGTVARRCVMGTDPVSEEPGSDAGDDKTWSVRLVEWVDASRLAIVTRDAVFLWDMGDVASWSALAGAGIAGAAALAGLPAGSLGSPCPAFAMSLCPDTPVPGTGRSSGRGQVSGATLGVSLNVRIRPREITRVVIDAHAEWLVVCASGSVDAGRDLGEDGGDGEGGDGMVDPVPVVRIGSLVAGSAQTVPGTWADLASLDATPAVTSNIRITAMTLVEGHAVVTRRLGSLAGGGSDIVMAIEAVPPGASDSSDAIAACAYCVPLSLQWLVSAHGLVALVEAESGHCVFAQEFPGLAGAVDVRGGGAGVPGGSDGSATVLLASGEVVRLEIDVRALIRHVEMTIGDDDAARRIARLWETAEADRIDRCAERGAVDGGDEQAVYVFGRNAAGQLGVGDTATRVTPYPMPPRVLPTGTGAIRIAAAGHAHSLLVAANGSVYVVGDDGCADDEDDDEDGGRRGGIDDNGSDRKQAPRLVMPAMEDDYPIRAYAGHGRSAVVMHSGAVFTFGDDAHGELGLGEPSLEPRVAPMYVHVMEPFRVLRAALGRRHTVFLTDAGDVYVCGRAGDTGLPRATAVPTHYALDNALSLSRDGGGKKTGGVGSGAGEDRKRKPVRAVAAGDGWSAAVLSDGRVVAWGSGWPSRVRGVGSSNGGPVPVQIEGHAVAVAAGAMHLIVLDADGGVHTCGLGLQGQLGLGQGVKNAAIPTKVKIGGGESVAMIAAGSISSYAVTTRGLLYAWGSGESGRLGTGDVTASMRPSLVASIGDRETVNDIAAGSAHVFAFTSPRVGSGDSSAKRNGNNKHDNGDDIANDDNADDDNAIADLFARTRSRFDYTARPQLRVPVGGRVADQRPLWRSDCMGRVHEAALASGVDFCPVSVGITGEADTAETELEFSTAEIERARPWYMTVLNAGSAAKNTAGSQQLDEDAIAARDHALARLLALHPWLADHLSQELSPDEAQLLCFLLGDDFVPSDPGLARDDPLADVDRRSWMYVPKGGTESNSVPSGTVSRAEAEYLRQRNMTVGELRLERVFAFVRSRHTEPAPFADGHELAEIAADDLVHAIGAETRRRWHDNDRGDGLGTFNACDDSVSSAAHRVRAMREAVAYASPAHAEALAALCDVFVDDPGAREVIDTFVEELGDPGADWQFGGARVGDNDNNNDNGNENDGLDGVADGDRRRREKDKSDIKKKKKPDQPRGGKGDGKRGGGASGPAAEELFPVTEAARLSGLPASSPADGVNASEEASEATPSRALLVTGPPGCGKSALVAHWIEQLAASDDRPVVIAHVVGAHPTGERTVAAVVDHLERQIRAAVPDWSDPASDREIAAAKAARAPADALRILVARGIHALAPRRVVVLVDGAELLSDDACPVCAGNTTAARCGLLENSVEGDPSATTGEPQHHVDVVPTVTLPCQCPPSGSGSSLSWCPAGALPPNACLVVTSSSPEASYAAQDMQWSLVSPAPLGRNDRAELASGVVSAGCVAAGGGGGVHGSSALAVGVNAEMLIEAVALGGGADQSAPTENADEEGDDPACAAAAAIDLLPLRSRAAAAIGAHGDVLATPAGLTLVRALIECDRAEDVVETLVGMLPAALHHSGVTQELVAVSIAAAELATGRGLPWFEFQAVVAGALAYANNDNGNAVDIDSLVPCKMEVSRLHTALEVLMRNATEIFERPGGGVRLTARARAFALGWAGITDENGVVDHGSRLALCVHGAIARYSLSQVSVVSGHDRSRCEDLLISAAEHLAKCGDGRGVVDVASMQRSIAEQPWFVPAVTQRRFNDLSVFVPSAHTDTDGADRAWLPVVPVHGAVLIGIDTGDEEDEGKAGGKGSSKGGKASSGSKSVGKSPKNPKSPKAGRPVSKSNSKGKGQLPAASVTDPESEPQPDTTVGFQHATTDFPGEEVDGLVNSARHSLSAFCRSLSGWNCSAAERRFAGNVPAPNPVGLSRALVLLARARAVARGFGSVLVLGENGARVAEAVEAELAWVAGCAAELGASIGKTARDTVLAAMLNGTELRGGEIDPHAGGVSAKKASKKRSDGKDVGGKKRDSTGGKDGKRKGKGNTTHAAEEADRLRSITEAWCAARDPRSIGVSLVRSAGIEITERSESSGSLRFLCSADPSVDISLASRMLSGGCEPGQVLRLCADRFGSSDTLGDRVALTVDRLMSRLDDDELRALVVEDQGREWFWLDDYLAVRCEDDGLDDEEEWHAADGGEEQQLALSRLAPHERWLRRIPSAFSSIDLDDECESLIAQARSAGAKNPTLGLAHPAALGYTTLALRAANAAAAAAAASGSEKSRDKKGGKTSSSSSSSSGNKDRRDAPTSSNLDGDGDDGVAADVVAAETRDGGVLTLGTRTATVSSADGKNATAVNTTAVTHVRCMLRGERGGVQLPLALGALVIDTLRAMCAARGCLEKETLTGVRGWAGAWLSAEGAWEQALALLEGAWEGAANTGGVGDVDCPTSLVSITLALARCLVEVPDPDAVAASHADAPRGGGSKRSAKGAKGSKSSEAALPEVAPAAQEGEGEGVGNVGNVETRLQRAERLARWCLSSLGPQHRGMIEEAEEIVARAMGDAVAGNKGKGSKGKVKR